MFKKGLIAAAAAAFLATGAMAADFKVGVVNPGKILAESAPAVAPRRISSRATSRAAKTN